MDYCSAFINGQALFGRYPTPEIVEDLESRGVTLFVDLTFGVYEGLEPYEIKAGGQKISYPIEDMKVPYDSKDFRLFIESLAERLRHGEKMYVHCRGGHGRSGLVVACILKALFEITAEQALQLTNLYHSSRRVMPEKFRRIGSPQTRAQKDFVRNYQPIYPAQYQLQ
jgi:protein-tyrosine phosphatase